MIILINRATKLSGYFLKMDKIYRAKILLGVTTDTWDLEGDITGRAGSGNISMKDFKETAGGLKGVFIQEPPVYSAKKINGKPAYYYARNKGIDTDKIVLKKNSVKIYEIETEYFCMDEAILKIRCSSGTYVRSIVHEIGQRLGCGAILTGLTRTVIGDFSLENSVSLEDLEDISLMQQAGDGLLENNYKGFISTGNTTVDNYNGNVF